MKEFKLKEAQGTNIHIFDNLGARIKNDEELRFVLENFYKSSTFFLRFEFIDANKNVGLITSDVSIIQNSIIINYMNLLNGLYFIK